MTRKGEAITLSVTEKDKEALESLAAEFGMTWGEKPSISKLIKEIARKKLRIAVDYNWSRQRIESLEQARKLLLDLGYDVDSQEIARLLLDRPELFERERNKLEQFLAKVNPRWRQKIDSYIKQQQPFRLTYSDVTEREWYFTVLHATWSTLEKHQYLVCTCEETEGNQDIPELQHNWTLRLDRIPEAVITPIKLPWQKELKQISVQFRVYGNLAFTYAKADSKSSDALSVSDIDGDPPRVTITQNIYSTFWFFRQISAYWDNCLIISPDSVRERFKTKVQSLYRQYQDGE